MKLQSLSLMGAALLCSLSPNSRADEATKDVADEMAVAAKNFLAALEPEQAKKAMFELAADERGNWHYIPKDRNGLAIKEMRPDQRQLAHVLLSTGMSQAGYGKSVTIMSLERVLHVLENNSPKRDAEGYHVSIFGKPGAPAWGWRFEGHHLSHNFTVVKGEYISVTPSFYGANPGEIDRDGAKLRVLGDEEDLGLALMESLDAEQKKTATVGEKAPKDILTTADRRVKPLPAGGIRYGDLNEDQQKKMQELVKEYLYRHRPAIADAEAKAIIEDGAEDVVFAWMGGTAPGDGKYYRVQGKHFLLEYDNTQNDAKHPHAVWRSFENDFGEDLLKKHYQQAHAN